MCGFYTGAFLYRYIHQNELQSLKERAKTIAALIPASSLSSLSFSEEDISNLVYDNLKSKLKEILSFYDDTRFIYLIGKQQDKIFFIVDSENPDSPDYSPPGQEYAEASDGVKYALSKGEVVVEGPVADRWGYWYSSLAPIKNINGQTVAIVGLDIDARFHTTYLYTTLTLVAVATLLLIIFILSIYKNRRDEEKLLELKSEFISLASHELRSPLTFMRWKISNLLESSDLSKELAKSLLEIKESAVKLITMATSILETTATDFKIATRKNLVEVDIFSSVQSAIGLVEDRKNEKEISIIVDPLSVKEAVILGEGDKLELIFTNILSNAIKYSPNKSTIEILILKEKNKVSVAIRDQGVGIPPGDIKYIFSGFYRAKNVARGGVRGSGFGLYMTKKIVEFLGGMIECKSTEGKGTTFIVYFPQI